MTFEGNDPRKRLSVRADETLHEAIERLADEQGVSKSEFVRRTLREKVPDENDNAPSNRKRRDAYQWLTHRADDNNRVPTDLALSKLAQKYQIDKRFVKRLYLKPLEREGWIKARYDTIRIRRPVNGANSEKTTGKDNE